MANQWGQKYVAINFYYNYLSHCKANPFSRFTVRVRSLETIHSSLWVLAKSFVVVWKDEDDSKGKGSSQPVIFPECHTLSVASRSHQVEFEDYYVNK